jgi:hypothetical protein
MTLVGIGSEIATRRDFFPNEHISCEKSSAQKFHGVITMCLQVFALYEVYVGADPELLKISFMGSRAYLPWILSVRRQDSNLNTG